MVHLLQLALVRRSWISSSGNSIGRVQKQRHYIKEEVISMVTATEFETKAFNRMKSIKF